VLGDDLSQAWTILGERIDAASENGDETGFLTRFALLLAVEMDSIDRFISLADEALAAAAHRKEGSVQ
jgi:hypothetical protein